MATEQQAGDELAPYRPTDLDAMACLLLGEDPGAPPLPAPTDRRLDTALGRALLPALQAPPCGVSFSGGLDSSLVLAVAAGVARREGLPLPVPLTLRWPGLPEADEVSWQEMVVRHLDLPDWTRLDLTTEVDLTGPEAEAVVRRHGLLSPPNLHVHGPLLRQVRGGSLLTGVGGDEVFGTSGELRVLVDRPPVWRWPRSAASLALDAAPVAVQLRLRGGDRLRYPWLRPPAQAEVRRALAEEAYGRPLRWDVGARAWWRSRQLQSNRRTLVRVGADHEVTVTHPLLDPAFLATAIAVGGALGLPPRLNAVHEHFGHLLPPGLFARRDKAVFNRAIYAEPSQRFMATWDGTGLDPAEVDVDALRREWRSPQPDARSSMLVQRAWAVSRGLVVP